MSKSTHLRTLRSLELRAFNLFISVSHSWEPRRMVVKYLSVHDDLCFLASCGLRTQVETQVVLQKQASVFVLHLQIDFVVVSHFHDCWGNSKVSNSTSPTRLQPSEFHISAIPKKYQTVKQKPDFWEQNSVSRLSSPSRPNTWWRFRWVLGWRSAPICGESLRWSCLPQGRGFSTDQKLKWNKNLRCWFIVIVYIVRCL